MACTAPFDAWPPAPNAEDQRYVFTPKDSFPGARAISLPCGRCTGCREAKARDWATRIHHEAKMHASNAFITPTYDDQHLPADGSISIRTHQLLIKRLRNELGELRFFGVGEYGGQFGRPHYHTILFGADFTDKRKWKDGADGHTLYRSATMERIWPYGQCLIGSVTANSARYCARYTLKKLATEQEATKLTKPHPVTGQLYQVNREFAVMSRRPGIGSPWYERYERDAFPSDYVVVDGQRRQVPSYYFDKLKRDKPQLAELIQLAREDKGARPQAAENNTESRLITRHELNRLKAKDQQRTLEKGG